ncbi:hypothetical protein [Marinicrinis lubricantis]|uniref:Uncharacterized protein n=1 Tax=Marinicrinis lubricantis TaxID=2086470 RepID=A0ABW1IJY7_9BACL
MYHIHNETFAVDVDRQGIVNHVSLRRDPHRMNWFIEPAYLDEVGYPDHDKLMGNFKMVVNGKSYSSADADLSIKHETQCIQVGYRFTSFTVTYIYSTSKEGQFQWTMECRNHSRDRLQIDQFQAWFSAAYVMFRDLNVRRNMSESCAIFPSISPDYTRMAAVRRDHRGMHLGIFNTKGRTQSIGTFCRYENKFLEQVSPSLDGMLHHCLVLADGTENPGRNPLTDWMYKPLKGAVMLDPEEATCWEYVMVPYQDEAEYMEKANMLQFPWIEYTPVLVAGGQFQAAIKLPEGRTIKSVQLHYTDPLSVISDEVTDQLRSLSAADYQLRLLLDRPGEHQLTVMLDDGSVDMVIFSVLERVRDMIEARVQYLCDHSFEEDEHASHPFAFKPVSNQGESLGKLALILEKNRIGPFDADQVWKVEQCAVYDVKNRWFEEGDFHKPKKLYGSFYRIFDFDYIGYVFYLLSRFDSAQLKLHSPETYLAWAAEMMLLRFDETRHEDERERRETKLTGVFTLYIQDLLNDLKGSGLKELGQNVVEQYERFGKMLAAGSEQYLGAITEHYYDNAGFGPACEALCLMGRRDEAEKYGELILANIGFSNDYRAQNPDRWWEALAYMTHSLWGGLVAGACLTAYEHFKSPDYIQAAYRSMMAIFSCYDWHIRSTEKVLERGEAASTFCVASPNLNKPELSHNRFGQSVFQDDIELLADNATGDDWDMGAELAAYLHGFGTKTFLYEKNGQLCCANGFIEELNGRTVVTSYAAYPRAYYYFDRNHSLIAADGEMIRSIIVTENGLQPLVRESTKRGDKCDAKN